MPSIPYEYAISRCPTEIWLRIFHEALHVQTIHECEDPFSAIGVDAHNYAAICEEWTRSMRSVSLSTGLSLVLVCKAWRACVEPMLYEWLVVHSWGLLKNPQPLERKIGGHSIGSLVRRLDIDMSRRAGDDYTHSREFQEDVDSLLAEENADEHVQASLIEHFAPRRANALVGLCPNIESFKWTGYGWRTTIPTLDRLPVSKLRTMSMFGYGLELSLDSFATFLCSCPILAVLEIGSGVLISSDSWTGTSHQSVSLGLESLSIRICELNAPFYSFLSSLALPKLQNLSLHEAFEDPEATFTPILPLLDVIGNGLTSLAVNGVYEEERPMQELPIVISKCPRLQELVFETPEGVHMPVDWAHESLRRVGIHGFFRTGGLPSMRKLQEHVQILRSTMQTLCSPAFPRLEVVRLLNVIPRSTANACCTFESDYIVLCEQLLELSQEASVRLEDCLGNPISLYQGLASLGSPVKHEYFA